MVRVILFTIALFIFTFFLTLARTFIVDNAISSPVTGKVVQSSQPANLEKLPPELHAQVLSLRKNKIIQDIPKNAIILFQIEGSIYTINKGSIVSGAPSEPDISIYLPGKYAQSLIDDLCSTLKTANNNGDLKINQHLSKTSLVWKYKSILKYRNCLTL